MSYIFWIRMVFPGPLVYNPLLVQELLAVSAIPFEGLWSSFLNVV